MSPQKQAEYEELLLAASKLEGKERERFLDERCAGKPDVRHAIETLLEGMDESGRGGTRPILVQETTGLKRGLRRRTLSLVEPWLRFIASPNCFGKKPLWRQKAASSVVSTAATMFGEIEASGA